MKAVKSGILLLALAFSSIASAGYSELEVNNGIVYDPTTGLEWIQWDRTVGFNVRTARSNFGGDGWEIASGQSMVDLFELFGFSLRYDTYKGSIGDAFTLAYTNGDSFESDPAYAFNQILGVTTVIDYGKADILEQSAAIFGGVSGLFSVAKVHDDYESEVGVHTSNVQYAKEYVHEIRAQAQWSVAMTRFVGFGDGYGPGAGKNELEDGVSGTETDGSQNGEGQRETTEISEPAGVFGVAIFATLLAAMRRRERRH